MKNILGIGSKPKEHYKHLDPIQIIPNLERAKRDLTRAKESASSNNRAATSLYVSQVALRLHNIELSLKE